LIFKRYLEFNNVSKTFILARRLLLSFSTRAKFYKVKMAINLSWLNLAAMACADVRTTTYPVLFKQPITKNAKDSKVPLLEI